MSAGKVDIQEILNLKISECDGGRTYCLKDNLRAHNIHTVRDLTKISKSELLKLFPDSCNDVCFLDHCIRDIEHFLKNFGLSLAQDYAEKENNAYKMLQKENEDLKQENAFLKEVVKYFAKELIKDTGK